MELFGECELVVNNILFTDKEHSWRVPAISFNYGVTIPIPEMRAVFSSLHEWSWLKVDEILERSHDVENGHKNFWEIVECMKSMNTLYDLIHMYVMGGSHVGSHKIDLIDEVKAIETLKTWIKFANEYHRLVGFKEKIEMNDKLVVKIAREARPTLLKMPNGSKYYDDKKSEIVFLSPYEDNEKTLREHKTAKNFKVGKNRIKRFIKGKFTPFKVGY